MLNHLATCRQSMFVQKSIAFILWQLHIFSVCCASVTKAKSNCTLFLLVNQIYSFNFITVSFFDNFFLFPIHSDFANTHNDCIIVHKLPTITWFCVQNSKRLASVNQCGDTCEFLEKLILRGPFWFDYFMLKWYIILLSLYLFKFVLYSFPMNVVTCYFVSIFLSNCQ